MSENSETKWTGAAFPCAGGVDTGLYADPGMSIRDYFAAQALIGIGTWMPGTSGILAGETAQLERARWAYAQADAMLKAREA